MSDKEDKILFEKNFFLQFFVSDKHRVYRHLLLIGFMILVLLNGKAIFIEPALSYSRIAALVVFLLLFYTNMYLLVPRFLFKNMYVAYCLAVVAIITISASIYVAGWRLLDPYVSPDFQKEDLNLLSFSFIILVLVSASSAIKLFQRSIKYGHRINELEKTTLQSEMEQLKNQINPHFLFNMLNNANVLTQRDPAKASQVLMKLSDLLRYQLYDSARTSVLLTAEIHFLEDFLNLEKVRRDHFECIVSKQGELSGVQIAPLMLITFVENAVKHNMDAEKQSYVHLYFDVKSDEVRFKCINSKPRMTAVRNRLGGLGLANVKRRLELIYPSGHEMKIEDLIDTYTVTLTIKL